MFVSVSLRSYIHSYWMRTYAGFHLLESFRLLTKLYSFLLSFMELIALFRTNTFPSPYGVSFILISYRKHPMKDFNWVSVSLRSYIHSYYLAGDCDGDKIQIMFPSPYGVSFILTPKSGYMVSVQDILKFPSPYGVIFILIN